MNLFDSILINLVLWPWVKILCVYIFMCVCVCVCVCMCVCVCGYVCVFTNTVVLEVQGVTSGVSATESVPSWDAGSSAPAGDQCQPPPEWVPQQHSLPLTCPRPQVCHAAGDPVCLWHCQRSQGAGDTLSVRLVGVLSCGGGSLLSLKCCSCVVESSAPLSSLCWKCWSFVDSVGGRSPSSWLYGGGRTLLPWVGETASNFVRSFTRWHQWV